MILDTQSGDPRDLLLKLKRTGCGVEVSPQEQGDGEGDEAESQGDPARNVFVGATKGKHEECANDGHQGQDGEPRKGVHRVAPHSRKPASAMSAMPIMRR